MSTPLRSPTMKMGRTNKLAQEFAFGDSGNPAQVNGQYYAFAVYRAPRHFVSKAADKSVSERAVTLDVTSGGNYPASIP